ncbi:MAG TPA: hypothetical protein PLM25_08235 [Limnochordia bacterium]|nr:hypothetical protein [Limnochordia bacterium]
MPTKTQIIGQFLLIFVLGLLLLTLFDSNPWWKVLLYAVPAGLLCAYLKEVLAPQTPSSLPAAGLQGLAAALLAYLVGLTPFFRTTAGTLVGFALLVSLGELLLTRLVNRAAP